MNSKVNTEVFTDTMNTMLINGQYNTNYLFYAHMIAKCVRIFDTAMEAVTAVSFNHTYYILYINPNMFNTFSLENRLAVLKHEMLHILNGHLTNRLEDRNIEKWNYATDCAINQLIESKHLAEGCVLPLNLPTKQKEVLKEKNAEYYYSIVDIDGESENNAGKSSNSPKVLDDHSKWGDSVGDKALQKSITKDMIEDSINKTQKSRGNLPSNISEYLKLHASSNEINWKRVLKNVLGNKKTGTRRVLTRRDRRFLDRAELKGKAKDRKFDLLVVSDVSGSISNESLLHLLQEIKNICDITQTPVDLIQVDTEPSKPEKLKKNTKLIERKASGGTYLSPAIAKAKEYRLHFDAIVVTTDGYLPKEDVEIFNKLNKKVFWLIEVGGKIMPSMNNGSMRAFQLKNKIK